MNNIISNWAYCPKTKKTFLKVEDYDQSKIAFGWAEGGYRDPSIDVLKGIAIVLVVYGHTWPFCRNFIYLFHMAVFMMASGILYSGKIDSIREYLKYIIKKIKGLYIPFVICNATFVLCGGVFIKLGIYTTDPSIATLTKSWPVVQTLYPIQGFITMLKELIKVFMFVKPTQLGTATWFLSSLFAVQVVHAGVQLLIKSVEGRLKNVINVAIMLIMLLGAQLISINRPHWVFIVKCFPCTYAAFLFGFLIRKIKWRYIYTWWMGSISFCVLVILSFSFSIEVSAGRISNIAVFVVSSVSGWILLKAISEMLIYSGVNTEILQYIGKHTMSILCLHVLSFKIVSLIYIKSKAAPKVLLAGFHVIFDANEIWKGLYLVAGIGIPLLLYWIYGKAINAIRKI